MICGGCLICVPILHEKRNHLQGWEQQMQVSHLRKKSKEECYASNLSESAKHHQHDVYTVDPSSKLHLEQSKTHPTPRSFERRLESREVFISCWSCAPTDVQEGNKRTNAEWVKFCYTKDRTHKKTNGHKRYIKLPGPKSLLNNMLEDNSTSNVDM